jgi:predicted phage terminase large subunit-like protein
MPSGKPIWPGYWSLKALESVKRDIPSHKWAAQYQQNPTSKEGAIIKDDWWMTWEDRDPPKCEYIIQSWDTGFLKDKSADPSAMTTWGVFYRENETTGRPQANIILLDAYTQRLEFPELKEKVFEFYSRWKPDTVVVEAKASGLPLYFEMRKVGVPIQTYNPTRGNSKRIRVNAVSDLFSSGVIWAPDRPYAKKVIEEFSDFPHGEFDDLVDSSTQALIRFRQGGFVPLGSDYVDEEPHEAIDASEYY